jgi:V8-like Glu-specific endopeptidase
MNTNSIKMKSFSIAISVLFTGFGATGVLADKGKVVKQGETTAITFPDQESAGKEGLDYENAKPMPMPTVDLPPSEVPAPGTLEGVGPPGSVGGGRGDGKENPVRVVPKDKVNLKGTDSESRLDSIAPAEFGTANLPYTTSRVDLSSNTVSKLYPYQAAGKLFFKKPDGTYMCSASLIKKGLVVTAAHCVANFGNNQFYSNWEFNPAYYDGLAPYGKWTVKSVRVMTSYINGTDPCASASPGVVCKNDIAVMSLNPQSGRYAGDSTGWYGYGWNGYGFTGSSFSVGTIALINQLGYPSSHDGGNRMQRTDAEGYTSDATTVNNTIWGSRQTGGSSGGPELVNLGQAAVLSGGVNYGSEAQYNTVVGVTSWVTTASGYAVKKMGASPFLDTNIVKLVDAECAGGNPACRL